MNGVATHRKIRIKQRVDLCPRLLFRKRVHGTGDNRHSLLVCNADILRASMRDGLNMLGSLIKLLLVRRNQALCSGKHAHSSKRANRKWHCRSSNNRMDVFKRNRRRKCNRGNRQACTSGQSGRKSAMCANVRSHDQNPFDYSQSNISGFRYLLVGKSHVCAPAENDEVSCSWETLGPLATDYGSFHLRFPSRIMAIMRKTQGNCKNCSDK